MNSSNKHVRFQNSLTAVVILASIVTIFIYWDELTQSLLWFSNLDAIIASIHGYGALGPIILSLLFILQTFLAFIPGQALMVASGYVYGFTGGILITWISLVVGGQLAFWLARRYGRPFAEKWIAPATLDLWDKSAAGQGIGFYVFTLVLPFFPNDAMCYVAGLSGMSGKRFIVANMLGRGIASFLTVLIGAFSEKVPGLLWVGMAGFVILGIVGWFLARKYSRG